MGPWKKVMKPSNLNTTNDVRATFPQSWELMRHSSASYRWISSSLHVHSDALQPQLSWRWQSSSFSNIFTGICASAVVIIKSARIILFNASRVTIKNPSCWIREDPITAAERSRSSRLRPRSACRANRKRIYETRRRYTPSKPRYQIAVKEAYGQCRWDWAY